MEKLDKAKTLLMRLAIDASGEEIQIIDWGVILDYTIDVAVQAAKQEIEEKYEKRIERLEALLESESG